MRNDDFNANLFFNNANGVPRPILKRNQFGGTAGDPVFVPRVLNGKDHLFWFFGYQGTRLSALQQNPAVTTYTPAELNGDFSHAVSGGPDPKVAAFLQNFHTTRRTRPWPRKPLSIRARSARPRKRTSRPG